MIEPCPTQGVCPPCREGWGHWTPGQGFVQTIESGYARRAVVHEWRVTGEPGQGYPTYEFTWRSDRPDWPGSYAEQRARAFVAGIGDGWDEGPRMHHRTVTYSPWEAVDV